MLTRDETPQPAQASALLGHSRLRRWMVRRARQLLVVVLILVTGLLVVACGVAIRRATCLIGLPDVGDPFDVMAFRAFSLPEDQDAFVVIRQAAAKLLPMPDLPMLAQRASPAVIWSQADPKLREWAEANHEALSLFQQGAARPDGAASVIDPGRFRLEDLKLRRLAQLALLDASRREEQGDMAAAWDRYRAILRMKAHIMRRGTAFERYVTDLYCRGLQARVSAWTSDPRTQIASIRQALNDIRACEPKAEWEVFSLKLDFLHMMFELDRPDGWVQHGDDEDLKIRLGDLQLPPDLEGSVYAARRFLIREPERSRRVLRLVYANWLAHAENSNPRNRKPAVRGTFRTGKQDTTLSFYSVDPNAPAAAHGLSPDDLTNWLVTTRDAKLLLFQWLWPAIRIAERRDHHALTIMLANELYHRERGTLPPSEEMLVGPYLDHLPGDGSDEVDDGSAQRVDDSRGSIPGEPD
jgi:hypothetical protein